MSLLLQIHERDVPAPVVAPQSVSFKKTDADQQLVFAEVYVPNIPDSQGDLATAEEIQKMAYGFLQKGLTQSIDLNHDGQPCGAYVVESFIARKGDVDGFIEGAWVLGVHIPSPEIWNLVKTGELNGFSFEGIGFKQNVQVQMEVPDLLKGDTDEYEGHHHSFSVQYGPEGEFLGGVTSVAPDGHYHVIKKGTATEVSSGHSHRFSFVEGIISAEIVG